VKVALPATGCAGVGLVGSLVLGLVVVVVVGVAAGSQSGVVVPGWAVAVLLVMRTT
jgi:hypothetical protein